MTPLPQQLEDKKKGLMNDQEMRDYIMSEFVNSGFITVHQWRNFVDYLQIMIKRQLEQAIAEMQKQRQSFIDIINSLGEIRGKSNDLQCIKLGESFSTNSVEWLKKELLKQLNQPKTEYESKNYK